MAVYHLSAKVVSRGKGQSAVASASYRSGDKLKDERTGEIKFYRRDVHPETMILAPSHSPEWVTNREHLWNEVERAENRVNSQLARDVEISLPRELSQVQQKKLIQGYAQERFVNQGMIADVAIHRDDPENPHAHIMLTTREISPEGFTKKNRDWNGKNQLENWREQWSIYANKAMEREGINERIDHRSFQDREKEELPTHHLGYQAHAMEKKGIRTERGDYNREVKAYNQELRKNIVDLQKYREEKQRIENSIKDKAEINKADEMIKERQQEIRKGYKKIQGESAEPQKPKQKFLTKSELADIKKATKSVKGYVTLDKITARKEQIQNWNKSLDRQKQALSRQYNQFKKAESYTEKLHDIEQKKARAQNEIKAVKDIKGVWQQSKWQGTKKAFNRTFNRREGNERIEKAQKDIQFLERHEQNFNKYLEPYRKELNFQTREEFYRQMTKFEGDQGRKMNDIGNQRSKAREEKETLNKAEQNLERREVREITSHYPELKHLEDTMRHKDALKLKEINDLSGRTVPVNELRSQLQDRTDTIKKSEQRLEVISNSERRIERSENNLNKREEVQSKIDKYDKSPWLKGKRLFSKNSKQEYDRLKMQRDQLDKSLDKDGFSSREDLDKYKDTVERAARKERPQLKQDIQQAKEGKSGLSIEKMQEASKSIDRAEKDYQKERRQRNRQNEKSRDQDIELEI